MEQALPFHQQLKYERERRGWSQAHLAEKLNSDFKTVSRWEIGKCLPRPYHRQILCELFGKSAQELGLIQKVGSNALVVQVVHGEDWGDAPLGGTFYGRDKELLQLEQWIAVHRCRVVAILGIGGIGKTTLAAKTASSLRSSFEYVFWRSLHNTPPVQYFLKQCLQCISEQQRTDILHGFDEQLLFLVRHLRDHRCLLVLDNVESIMQDGRHDSLYLKEYEGYGRLIQCLGEVQHQSCLLLTSREKPKEVALLEGNVSVQSLHLSGIGSREGREILKDKGLFGSDGQWAALIDLYSGNPLALKLISDSIREIFGGNIAYFIKEEELAFGYINDLIGQQFHRLSTLAQEILYWLAIEREAVSLESIYNNFVQFVMKGDVFAALESLRRSFFIEMRGSSQFTLQPVIMEYVTNNLVKRACEEFISEEMNVWINFTFLKAQSKDYVRESQERLIVTPIAQRLISTFGREGVEQKLQALLTTQRQKYPFHRNYVASNIIKILIHLVYNLCHADFSHLVIWQVYLQDIGLQKVNFSYAHFTSSLFKSTFGNVLSVAFNSQENLLAMGTATGEVWIYHVLSGVAITSYSGHTDGVWSVAFHPSGRILASSSDDLTIRLWDVSTGRCLQVLQEHEDRVRSVAFNPDGRIIVSGSDDQTIRLWDVSTGRCLLILRGHTNRVWSVVFSPDGHTLATGSTDETICLWDITNGNCLKTLVGHKGWVRSVMFSPDGELLASGSDDQTVKLWDVTNGTCLKTLYAHANRVWSVAFSPDGSILASSSEDQSIRLWNVVSKTCYKAFPSRSHGAKVASFNPDGTIVASGGEDQTVRLWNVSTGLCLHILAGHTNWVRSVAFSPDGRMLASGSEDQTVRLWDVDTCQCLSVLCGHVSWVRSVAFSPDGSIFASGSDDQTVRLWQVGTSDCICVLCGHTGRVRVVAFSPDGRMLASGSEDQTVRLWNISTGDCLTILQSHTNWVRSLTFSPDGKILASGGDDRTIRLWDMSTQRCMRILHSHSDRVRSLAFDPSGQTLASGSDDGTIKIWNIQTAECNETLVNERPYEGMNIFGATGLTEAQKEVLRSLGAISSDPKSQDN